MNNLEEQKKHAKRMLVGAEGFIKGILLYFPPVQLLTAAKDITASLAIVREYERMVSTIVSMTLRHAPNTVSKIVFLAGMLSTKGTRKAVYTPILPQWTQMEEAEYWTPVRFMTILPTIPAPMRDLKYKEQILPPTSNLAHLLVVYRRWSPTKDPMAPQRPAFFSGKDRENAQKGSFFYEYPPHVKPVSFLKLVANIASNHGARLLLLGSRILVEDVFSVNGGYVYFAPMHPYKCFENLRMHPLAHAWIGEEEHNYEDSDNTPECESPEPDTEGSGDYE